ncbi:hypothetical protein GCM10009768_03300 [Leucobacter iarius]|uniref:Uncharacterized protein n=1 Tax=Leucobacter iarius TaxID=333963 RepID=A0ABP4XJH5_9MICO
MWSDPALTSVYEIPAGACSVTVVPPAVGPESGVTGGAGAASAAAGTAKTAIAASATAPSARVVNLFMGSPRERDERSRGAHPL